MKLDDLITAGPASAKTSGGVPAIQARAQDSSAWRREMERAQADAWFHGALPTPMAWREEAAHLHTDAPKSPERAAERQSHAAPRASSWSGLQSPNHELLGSTRSAGGHLGLKAPMDQAYGPVAAGAGAASASLGMPMPGVDLPASGDPAVTRSQHLLAQPVRGLAAGPLSGSPAQAGDAPIGHPVEGFERAGVRKTRETDAIDLPVRVHVEGDATQATVWLGVDAAIRTDLPALTEAIARWLTHAGYGPPSFICNGTALKATGQWREPAAHSDTLRASPSFASTYELIETTFTGDTA